MTLIYFIYGLSFYTLGISLLLYPKKGSRFDLAGSLSFIAFFGILHGINEWIDMVSYMQKPNEIVFLQIVGSMMLTASYFCLVLFGIKSIFKAESKYVLLYALPIILLISWIMITVLSTQHFLMGNIWSRYLLGIPGIFLTSYALLLYASKFKTRIPSIVANIKVAAGAFFFYGIFSGLIVPKAEFFPASFINDTVFMYQIGIPIQVFRAMCALVLTFSTLKILSIFNWETQELRNLSLTDDLTNLLNRRGFFNLAQQQLKIAKRMNKETLLLSADMDNLKAINDTFGHKTGDLALIDTANILRETFRESDVIARIGGDEFVVLQIENIDHHSNNITSRLQNNIDKLNIKRNRKYTLSISIGAIRNRERYPYSIEEMLVMADKLMYKHKKSKKVS